MSNPATQGIPDTAHRERVARHREVKRKLIEEWRERQKPGIAAKRGPIVAAACEWMVTEKADAIAWRENPLALMLLAVDIERCQQRAITQERARAFGPIPSNPEKYQQQYDEAKEAVLAGKRLKRHDTKGEPETMAELLGRIGRQKAKTEEFSRDFEQGKDGRYWHKGVSPEMRAKMGARR